jgi:N-acetylglucosamine-6-phosphate deacetylase
MLSVFYNGSIFTGEEVLTSHALIIDKDQVSEIIDVDDIPESITNRYDLKGNMLVPGFIDLQVNGGGGIMFNSEPNVETIKRMVQGHQRFGTTGMMPTLITTSFEEMEKAISAVEQAISENIPGVLGIHLEGPFLSEVKKGAHDASKFCTIDEKGFAIMTSARLGKTIVTIAPELTDDDTISSLNKKGIIICAGHTNANYQQTMQAIDAGLHGFTHLYNAMTPLESRMPGMVGAAISDERTWFGIIADGYHMHSSAFKIAVKAKQQGGAILVTDAMATVGSFSDTFILDNEEIKSINGKCVNSSGSLAGSDLNMNQAVKNAISFANISWQEAVRMASLYPAKALGLDHVYGKIKKGYKANFLILNDELDVRSTWINGIDVTSIN